MRLAWASRDLRELCRARDGVARVWPAHAGDVRNLLTAVMNSGSLQELQLFRCIRTFMTEALAPGTASLITIEHKEVQMVAVPLTADHRPSILRPVGDTPDWDARITGLHVQDLICNGETALKAAM